MRLTSLSLTSFRNHAETRHAFEGDLTVFIGKNAAGKTSLLEAVRCLSLAKSFRAVSDQDLISHGAAYCRAEALFLREGAERRIAYFQELAPPEGGFARKRILIDGVRRPVRQLLGTLPTVLFTPEDLALITNAPRVRRSYLDALLCQASPEYYASLVALRRILAQRNRLLGQIRETGLGEDQLDAWDAPFILHARTILLARKELLSRFNDRLSDAYGRIAGHPSVLRLSASTSLPEDKLDERLVAGRSADIRAARTLRGPHRDDITFLLSDLPLASFASRGEQRSAILALKDAELSILEEIFGERPILLLDDIFSELDADRQNALLELVRKQQTLITTTDLAHIHPATQEGAAIVEIQRGGVVTEASVEATEVAVHAHA